MVHGGHPTILPLTPLLLLLLQPTYEERAAAMEEVLQWFMVAIPRARGRPVDAWCSRPDGAAVRRAAQAALIAEQVCALVLQLVFGQQVVLFVLVGCCCC